MADTTVAELVQAARGGGQEAWRELIERFQDLAVAIALGGTGDLETARDAAQEAFLLAFRHLDDLDDPAAFPGWFARLARTASARQRRRRPEATVAADAGTLAASAGSDPAEIVVRRREAERVRDAVEALPERERLVVALHYLAGLSYPEIAAFLGIGLSAAKKRAHAARRRLEELLPMTTDLLSGSRPSRDGRFRDTILLFASIRRRDHGAVARLLARSPALANAREDWSAAEALDAGLPHAGSATALIRAAGTGDIEMVRTLVAAGADPVLSCACAGAETALWNAVLAGAADVVAFLLEAGADPGAAAFAGATPLHLAVRAGRGDIAALLLAAGADPDRADAGGRTAADWSRGPAGWSAGPPDAGLVPTGIRALDLFAPLRPGGLQRWPAAYGLGQLVVLAEIVRAAAGRTWWIGFEQAMVDAAEIAHLQAETGAGGTVRLVPRGTDAARARALFAGALDEVLRAGRPPALVVCFEAPGHAHDVAMALPRLAGAAGVAAALVVAPYAGSWPVPGRAVPDGYDGQVAFDRARVRRGLYPAVDPLATVSRRYPSERHARLAAAGRELLGWYAGIDPDLALPPPTPDAPATRARAAQELVRLLAHPLIVAEPFTSSPGERTPVDRLLDAVEAIVPATGVTSR